MRAAQFENDAGLTSDRKPKAEVGAGASSAEADIAVEHLPVHPVPFRGGGFDPKPGKWAGWLCFALLIAVWQIASNMDLVNSIFLPSPLQIAEALKRLAVSGSLFFHLSESLYRLALGWLVGAVAGVLFGCLMGLFSAARGAGLPLVSALFPVPKIALLPLFILWLGIGDVSKIATVALGVFFPMVISAYAGVDNVPRNLIRMGQSFNLPFHAIVLKIVVPGMLPSVLAGCRISASIALILLVSAEMIGTDRGIGSFLLTAGNLMQTDDLMAGIVVIAALGLTIGTAITMLERTWLNWR
jgi:NitT/TauT family transport system permease protein